MHKYLFIILFLPIFISAQNISLQEAESMALKNNLQIKISGKSVDIAKQDFRNAVGSVLPSINFYGQYTNNMELPVFILDIDGPGGSPAQTIPMGAKYNSTYGVSLTQPVFTGGGILAGYNIAKEGVNISKQNRLMEIDNTLLTVRLFWYQIQLTNSLISATEKSLASALGNLELAEKRKAAGTANQLEVLQARVNYESLKPNLITLRNQLKTVHSNLIAYLNEPNLETINVEGKLEKEENIFSGMDIVDLQYSALNNRIEMDMLNSQKKILTQMRNISYGMTLPLVSISADLRDQAQADLREDLEYFRSKNVSLNVSLPLFNGGKKIADIQKARINLKQADLQKELTETMIKMEVESLFLKVSETEKSIEANDYLKSQAKEALRLAKLMYENGSSTQLDVQNAESFYLQAQSAYYSSIFEYNITLNQLKKSLHKL